MHKPGIEPGSIAWQATILPLDHLCFQHFQHDIIFYNYAQEKFVLKDEYEPYLIDLFEKFKFNSFLIN